MKRGPSRTGGVRVGGVARGRLDNASAAARDARVRVLRQDRKFAGCARNLGLDAARGKWFIALDADDRFEPGLLEEAVRRGEEADAQVVLFDADGLAMPDGIRVPRPDLARASRLPAGTFSGATRLERCRQKRMCRVQALSVCRPECRKALEEAVGRIDAELKDLGEAP